VTVRAAGPSDPVEAADALAAPPSSPASTPLSDAVSDRASKVDLGRSAYRLDRRPAISRSAKRVTLHKKPDVVARRFMTSRLNLWPAPREKGRPLTVLPRGGRVAITGVRKAGFAQILYGGQVRWVHRAYLANSMPKPEPRPAARSTGADRPGHTPARTTTGSSHRSGSTGSSAARRSGSRSASGTASRSTVASSGISSAPCPDGSATESGLTSSAVRLFRAVCNAFPALSSYGGYDGHGEHSSGKAIDFMTSSSSLGQSVADWARAHASSLNLYDIIWAQHIWTPVRASEGWRMMPDRGSATANHYDHVHISVN